MGQFPEDEATPKAQSRGYWESMQQETLRSTSGKMPKFETAVVPGSRLQVTLTSIQTLSLTGPMWFLGLPLEAT